MYLVKRANVFGVSIELLFHEYPQNLLGAEREE
jgi:hypothetical protein